MSQSGLNPKFDRRLKGHFKAVTCVHFSRNMKQLASSGEDNFVMVWHIKEKKRTFRYSGHENHVSWVRFSPTDELLASASLDRTVRLWIPNLFVTSTLQRLEVIDLIRLVFENCFRRGNVVAIRAHSAAVRCVEFTSDGQNLVTASDDKTIKLWDVEKHRFLRSFTGHNNWVKCVSVALNNDLLASASDDKTVKLWDLKSSKCVHTFDGSFREALSVAFQPSNQSVAASYRDGSVCLWDVRTNRLQQLYRECESSAVAFDPSGKYLFSGYKIFDLLEGRVIYTINGDTGVLRSVNFASTGDLLACSVYEEIFLYTTNFTTKEISNVVGRIEEKKVTGAVSSSKVVTNSSVVAKNSTKDVAISSQSDLMQDATSAIGDAERVTTVERRSASRIETEEDRLTTVERRSASRIETEEDRLTTVERRSATHVEAEEDRLTTADVVVQQLASQVDVLVQTVSFMDERLTQMEDRFDQILTLNQELLKKLSSQNYCK